MYTYVNPSQCINLTLRCFMKTFCHIIDFILNIRFFGNTQFSLALNNQKLKNSPEFHILQTATK